jgi:hypothetical protein
MATFRKKRSRKYKRRNTRRNRRSKKSLVGGAHEEFKFPEVQKITGPQDLIQAIKEIIYNRGSNEQYPKATDFIHNMKKNIDMYTVQFKDTLNNNITIDDKRDKEAFISYFEPHLQNVKAKLDQLYKKASSISKDNPSPEEDEEESSIIEEARILGIEYYTAMWNLLKTIFDKHYN